MKLVVLKMPLILLIMLVSCISTSKLELKSLATISNKTFSFKSSIRTMNLVFDTADCQLTIIYNCPEISKDYQTLKINCFYQQLSDSVIIIKNKLYDFRSEQIDLTPPKEELEKCISLNLKNNKTRNKVSAWANDDGFIPSVTIDTIKVFSKKDKLFLFLRKQKGQDIYNFIWKEN